MTSYEGYVAWCEYPFAFAACLEQEECYRCGQITSYSGLLMMVIQECEFI